jgi:hypothetical protein
MTARALHLSALAAFLWTTGACLQDDPEHCANRGGAEACAAAKIGTHCSLCRERNLGCRTGPDPDPVCRVEDEPDEAQRHDGDTDPTDLDANAELGCDAEDDEPCQPEPA